MSAPAGLSGLPSIDHQFGSDPQLLGYELRGLIAAAIADDPRSRQREIGPSEIGSPCALRIGHKLVGTAAVNIGVGTQDGLKATFGTAMHAWLADVFAHYNAGLDVARWLVENRLDVAQLVDGSTLSGSCDLYDRVTGTVVDWKTTTLKAIRSYRANGVGEQYRVQAHSYGVGWINRGQPVENVAVMFIPRDGLLAQSYYWTEPHDIDVARQALQRLDNIMSALSLLPHEDVLRALPRAPSYCNWCPYFRAGATDHAEACPGYYGT